MAVFWDSLLVASVAAELRTRLEGARVRALHFDSKRRRALMFFSEGTLALALHPAEGGIILGKPTEPPVGSRRVAWRLSKIEAPPDDRLIILHFTRVRGRADPAFLAVELMSNQWNAALARGPRRTVAAVLKDRAGRRPVRVGLEYHRPPASMREGRDGALTEQRWLELLSPHEPADRRRVLLERVAWSSKLNAPALLGRASREHGREARRDLAGGYRLWRELLAASRTPSPALLRLDGDWQPYPAPLPGVEVQPQPDLLTAFERAAAPGGSPEEAVVPVSWLEAAEKHLGRALKRVRSLQSELDEAEDPDALSAVGDLLLSRLAEIPKGEARVGLEGFHGSRVDVAIDPSLHPHENADRYYSRAARARRARQRLPALIAEAEAAAGRAQRFLTRIRSGDVERSDLEQEFPELRALSPGTGVPLPYRVFHIAGDSRSGLGEARRRTMS